MLCRSVYCDLGVFVSVRVGARFPLISSGGLLCRHELCIDASLAARMWLAAGLDSRSPDIHIASSDPDPSSSSTLSSSSHAGLYDSHDSGIIMVAAQGGDSLLWVLRHASQASTSSAAMQEAGVSAGLLLLYQEEGLRKERRESTGYFSFSHSFCDSAPL